MSLMEKISFILIISIVVSVMVVIFCDTDLM
jgi:hypothetical protein